MVFDNRADTTLFASMYDGAYKTALDFLDRKPLLGLWVLGALEPRALNPY